MIIEVDEYKKKIAGYDPKKSEDFHIESSKMADQDFIRELKIKKYKNVVLMAGGTASGKTEYASSYLKNKNTLVYDATLKDFSGYKIKIQKINRYDKNIRNIKVILVIPQDDLNSFSAFLNRERKMRPFIYFDTQIKSKQTIAKILRETKTKVEIFASIYDKDKLSFKKLSMKKGRKNMAEILDILCEGLKKLAKDSGFEM